MQEYEPASSCILHLDASWCQHLTSRCARRVASYALYVLLTCFTHGPFRGGRWYASCFLQIRNARPTTRSKGKKAYLFVFDSWEESGGNQITMVNETSTSPNRRVLSPQGWLLGNAGINSEAAHGRCTSSTTPAAGRICLLGSSRKLEAGCAVPSPLLGMALQTRPGS